MFFDTRSFEEPKASMETFREWAGSIANQYLTGQVTPTAGVAKIAQMEDLTPPQIELLSAETNKLIHTQKHANATTDKYFAADFPHADAREVISLLQATGGTKVAAVAPDPSFSDDSADEYSLFGVERPLLDKTASVKRELKVAAEKVAMVNDKAKDRVILAKYAAENSEVAFIKTARQVVLSGSNSDERMAILGTIDHLVKTAKMEFAKTSLAKLAYVLGKEGLLYPQHADGAFNYFMSKESDVKAPQELISGWLQARVINGNHPLYITLKTFKDCAQSLRECSDRHSIIEDRLRITRQRIRAL